MGSQVVYFEYLCSFDCISFSNSHFVPALICLFIFSFEGVVVQSLSRVRLFAAPWTAARQASLSLTISGSLLRLMSIESVMLPNHLVLYHPFFWLQYFILSYITSLVAQMVKNLPAMQETWIWSLGWEDLPGKGMATHSSILA